MEILIQNIGYLTAALLLVVAVIFDLKFRIIPNWVCGCILLLGYAVQGAFGGASGLLDATLGMLLALGVFIPAYAGGWMGAGDAKLMAAVGALLGLLGTVNAIVYTLLVGGAFGLFHVIARNAVFVTPWLMRFYAPNPTSSKVFFPYAVAIASGSICAHFYSVVTF